jgi:hypothetical protein
MKFTCQTTGVGGNVWREFDELQEAAYRDATYPHMRVESDQFVTSSPSAATLSNGCSYSTFNPLSEYHLGWSAT